MSDHWENKAPQSHVTAVERTERAVALDFKTVVEVALSLCALDATHAAIDPLDIEYVAAEWSASCSCGWRSCPYRSAPRDDQEQELARDWALSAARVHRLARGELE
jgi:hypothetical protein